MPLPATPMALPRITPLHRDPFDPRAPQQAATPTGGEGCSLVCDHARYKYAYRNMCHSSMDVKKSGLTGPPYGTSTTQTSLVLTPMRMGHRGSEMQRKALRLLTSRSCWSLARTPLVSIRGGELGVNVPRQGSGVSSPFSTACEALHEVAKLQIRVSQISPATSK